MISVSCDCLHPRIEGLLGGVFMMSSLVVIVLFLCIIFRLVTQCFFS